MGLHPEPQHELVGPSDVATAAATPPLAQSPADFPRPLPLPAASFVLRRPSGVPGYGKCQLGFDAPAPAVKDEHGGVIETRDDSTVATVGSSSSSSSNGKGGGGVPGVKHDGPPDLALNTSNLACAAPGEGLRRRRKSSSGTSGGVQKTKKGVSSGGGGDRSAKRGPGPLPPITTTATSSVVARTRSIIAAAQAMAAAALQPAAAAAAGKADEVVVDRAAARPGFAGRGGAAAAAPADAAAAIAGGGGDGGDDALETLRSAMPAQHPLGPPGLPRQRRKPGRLRRAWDRFKRLATCSNVDTLDPPLHGVALTPGETAEDVSREAAEEEAEAAAKAAAAKVAAKARRRHAAPAGPAAAGGGGGGGGSEVPVPLPPRVPSLGAASERSRDYTGYLTTPANWHRGTRGGAVASDGYASSAGTTAGSTFRPTDPYTVHCSEQLDYDNDNGGSITDINGGSGRVGIAALSHGGSSADPGGAAAGVAIGSGGDGSDRPPAAAAAQQLPPGSCGPGSITDRSARGRCESISSGKSEGSTAGDEWHDARSFASNFSIVSCLTFSGGAAAADGGDDLPQPYHAHHLSTTRPPQQSFQHQLSDRVTSPPYGAGGAAAATAKAAAEALAAQGPAPPPSTPPPPRHQTPPPPEWSPGSTTGLTGHFSTPVLAPPHRTGSTTASGGVAAAAATAVAAVGSPLPAATPRAAAVEVEGVQVPLPTEEEVKETVLQGFAAGVLPAEERPNWVPDKPIPGLDPSTRFLPVPRVTGVASYWAKIPELSAPLPLPIDLALGANRLAKTAHESIRGILLRESDTELVLKARCILPLGVRFTHEERFHKDNSPYTILGRRDVKPGMTVTRMYYTSEGDVLLVCEAHDLTGRITHVGYELIHLTDNGDRILCRQWVLITSNGRIAEQNFVGRRAPLPSH